VGSKAKNDSEIQNASMMALFYLVLSCCNLQKLSYCLWWRQTDIITGAWTTVLTRDILPNLTTEAEIVLQAITIQMGCCSQDQLTDYWTKIDQFLPSILQQHDEMEQIITHPLVYAFHRQQKWS
jgi:hypothetical protein